MRLFCAWFLVGCSPTRSGGTSSVLLLQNIVKARRKWRGKCKTRFVLLCFVFMYSIFFLIIVTPPYHRFRATRVKKGDVKKKVYFWAGISWFCKTPGVAWTVDDVKVTFRHTKNLCHGTVFQDEDDDGNPCVFRVVQTRAAGDDNYVSYIPHFEFPVTDLQRRSGSTQGLSPGKNTLIKIGNFYLN